MDALVQIFLLFNLLLLTQAKVFSTDTELELDNYIDGFLKCSDVPGIGLAIVKDGETFSRGYGLADIEREIPATDSTIFCLGSVTKSMTAMLLARMISSGEHSRLLWSSKIKDILGAEYKFIDDCITESITLTDILSHRTGLSSADLLLQAGVPDSITRKHVMRNLHYLPKLFEFRDTFFYNNLVYVLSGHVAEVLADETWEELMKKELFLPLNMTSTVMLDNGDLPTIAVPYIMDLNGVLNISDKLLYRLHPFGPSGSVCSSAKDMTAWLKLITSKGKTNDGNQHISENVIKEQFEVKSTLKDMWLDAYRLESPPFPVIFDTFGYGFGWFTSYYRGHRLLHHSGSLYGYSCKIGYLPEINSAFVFFNNGPGETKFTESIDPIFFYVLDSILGYSTWLNKTTACFYPDFWSARKKKRSLKRASLDSEMLTNSDMYSGNYSHPLYGTVSISRENSTLCLSYGLILKGILKPAYNDFTLELLDPLHDVFLLRLHVTFSNLSQKNKFQNINITSLFEKYSFTRTDVITNNSLVFTFSLDILIFVIFVQVYLQ